MCLMGEENAFAGGTKRKTEGNEGGSGREKSIEEGNRDVCGTEEKVESMW